MSLLLAPHQSTQVRATPANRQELQRLLRSGDAYGTTLLMLAIDHFGTECLGWHPTTLRLSLQEIYGPVASSSFDSLMAAIAVVSTDLTARVGSFLPIAKALAGGGFQPELLDISDVLECAWACAEIFLLHPPTQEDPGPASEEVRAYLVEILRYEGFTRPPAVLKLLVSADALQTQYGEDVSGDPELFGELNAVQSQRVDEVDMLVREGLLELFEQIKMLPLHNGETAAIEKHISALAKTH